MAVRVVVLSVVVVVFRKSNFSPALVMFSQAKSALVCSLRVGLVVDDVVGSH